MKLSQADQKGWNSTENTKKKVKRKISKSAEQIWPDRTVQINKYNWQLLSAQDKNEKI